MESERKEKPMPTTVATVLSVNVGRPREFDYNGRLAKSAIWKSPVAGRIAARGVNLEGDDQADRKAHGGPDKSVYAYAIEDMRWWEEKLGRSLQYGEFGENLTTEGVAANDALVGERWAIGTAVFEVSEPRIPCWRLGVRMNDQGFVRRFTEALRPGTYLRIIVEGAVGAGDEIRIIERPAHDLTIRDIFRIYTRDREEVERLLAVPRISESWRRWAQHFLEETKGRRAGSAPPGCC
jgi:MOSC domain-containing protein YiiM